MQEKIQLAMTEQEITDICDSLADVLCWHLGFQTCAGKKYKAPPGIDDLRTLNIKLKRALLEQKSGGGK